MSNRSRPRFSERESRQIAEDVTVKFTLILPNAEASGSGFVVSASERFSWVMTNRHVVRGIIPEESEIYYAPSGQRAGFRILDCLPHGPDLAIIETELKFFEIPRISWRKNLTRGEPIFMFGYPGGHPRWHLGEYLRRRNDERGYLGTIDSKYMDVCDLRSAPGSSGSAIFDAYGDVIGVMSKGTDPGHSPSYIVPVPYVRRLLRDNRLNFVGAGQSDCETEYVGSRRDRNHREGLYEEEEVPEWPPRPRLRHRGRMESEADERDHHRRRRRPPSRHRRRRAHAEPVLCCAVM